MRKRCKNCGEKFNSNRAWKTCSKKCSKELNKQYHKDYYQKVKGLPYYKEMVKKSNEKYQRKHRKEIAEHKKHMIKKLREDIKALIGDTCLFCDSKKVCFHEIHGKRHNYRYTVKTYRYIIEHIQNFAPICRMHHNILHNISKISKNQNKILELLELLFASTS